MYINITLETHEKLRTIEIKQERVKVTDKIQVVGKMVEFLNEFSSKVRRKHDNVRDLRRGSARRHRMWRGD